MTLDRVKKGDPQRAEDQDKLVNVVNHLSRPDQQPGVGAYFSSHGTSILVPPNTRIGWFVLTEDIRYPSGVDSEFWPKDHAQEPNVPWSNRAKVLWFDHTNNEYDSDLITDIDGRTLFFPAAQQLGASAYHYDQNCHSDLSSGVFGFFNTDTARWEVLDWPPRIVEFEVTTSQVCSPGDTDTVTLYTASTAADREEDLQTVTLNYVRGEGLCRAPSGDNRGTKGWAIWNPFNSQFECITGDFKLIVEATSETDITAGAIDTCSLYWVDWATPANLIDSGIDVQARNWAFPNVPGQTNVIVSFDRLEDRWTIITDGVKKFGSSSSSSSSSSGVEEVSSSSSSSSSSSGEEVSSSSSSSSGIECPCDDDTGGISATILVEFVAVQNNDCTSCDNLNTPNFFDLDNVPFSPEFPGEALCIWQGSVSIADSSSSSSSSSGIGGGGGDDCGALVATLILFVVGGQAFWRLTVRDAVGDVARFLSDPMALPVDCTNPVDCALIFSDDTRACDWSLAVVSVNID